MMSLQHLTYVRVSARLLAILLSGACNPKNDAKRREHSKKEIKLSKKWSHNLKTRSSKKNI